MKTVLIVEDDPALQRYCELGLQEHGGFKVLTADDGRAALDTLARERVDVVVTDLYMPVMDGFELVAAASSRYPGLPILVLTGVPMLADLDQGLRQSTLRILSKPLPPELLAQAVDSAAERPPAGRVQGLSLHSLIQLLHWERKTCTLTVAGAGRLGHLYMRQGSLIAAACGALKGPEAVFEICTWPQPQVEFADACRVEPDFSLPTDQLLMELALRQDERSAPQD